VFFKIKISAHIYFQRINGQGYNKQIVIIKLTHEIKNKTRQEKRTQCLFSKNTQGLYDKKIHEPP
jgi:hypothetical protein